jgi:hypothetical protein
MHTIYIDYSSTSTVVRRRRSGFTIQVPGILYVPVPVNPSTEYVPVRAYAGPRVWKQYIYDTVVYHTGYAISYCSVQHWSTAHKLCVFGIHANYKPSVKFDFSNGRFRRPASEAESAIYGFVCPRLRQSSRGYENRLRPCDTRANQITAGRRFPCPPNIFVSSRYNTIVQEGTASRCASSSHTNCSLESIP